MMKLDLNVTNLVQNCSQFYNNKVCPNPSVVDKSGRAYDFCAKHNHMDRTGIKLKCWRCGD